MASSNESIIHHQMTPSNAPSAKRLDRTNEMRQKVALGDIKNTPSVTISAEKSPMKKVAINTVEEPEYASSKHIDYFNVWVDKNVLSDDEITQWINRLNVARTMIDADEIETPPPYIQQEILSYSLEDENEFPQLSIPAMPLMPECDLDTSECQWSDDTYVWLQKGQQIQQQQEQPSTVLNDSMLSELNRSVFELYDSDEELSNSL